MARLLTTGFETGEAIEHNGAIVGLVTPVVQSTYKRTGGYGLEVAAMNSIHKGAFTHTLGALPAEIFVRLAFMYRATLGVEAGEQNFLALFDGGTAQLSLGLDRADFTLVLRTGGTDILGYAGGSELARGPLVLQAGAWYVLEMRAKIDNAVGVCTVKVNGVTDFTFNGDTQATANARVSNVQVGSEAGGIGQGSNFYFDDVAINDTTGALQNTWIGTGGCYYLKPTSDGALTQWVPSSGTDHYALVDEVPKNTTDWNSENTSGDIDLYGLENLPAEVVTVDLVEVIYQAALAQAGQQQIKDVVRHAAVNYEGAAQYINTVHPAYYLYKGAPYYEVLGGAGAWSPAQVNALEAGVKIA